MKNGRETVSTGAKARKGSVGTRVRLPARPMVWNAARLQSRTSQVATTDGLRLLGRQSCGHLGKTGVLGVATGGCRDGEYAMAPDESRANLRAP